MDKGIITDEPETALEGKKFVMVQLLKDWEELKIQPLNPRDVEELAERWRNQLPILEQLAEKGCSQIPSEPFDVACLTQGVRDNLRYIEERFKDRS